MTNDPSNLGLLKIATAVASRPWSPGEWVLHVGARWNVVLSYSIPFHEFEKRKDADGGLPHHNEELNSILEETGWDAFEGHDTWEEGVVTFDYVLGTTEEK